eukprot:CAMPEP_0174369118 /NCGR_PEP_ID=MMETSP0811_2-20130205/91396_1 /TAXON_ID=73025 ORGANISM="Eutreptiella gymnastica-like, Strain CCMP1594" /NCGR_SAMPLE_ID=MMETSP0811_2 /ASSEMBLY_ACC=CAM_ASM_000667 /LENGTH=62 /DNA_ID=CAMNT_0015513243 /DNA_START=27 /DNA_END=215 /DNA_ORIENTATION=-
MIPLTSLQKHLGLGLSEHAACTLRAVRMPRSSSAGGKGETWSKALDKALLVQRGMGLSARQL